MAKREYLQTVRPRYLSTTKRTEKSQLLNEICATTGYDRKYIIRWLSDSKKKGRKPNPKPGRKPIYQDKELLIHLKAIWKAANLPCSKRLKAIIPIWLPHYERMHKHLEPTLRAKILRMSPATMDRHLFTARLQLKGRGLSTTKPGGLLRHQIPIQTAQWKETRPGFLEADTVAHCGGSMAGEFVFTLDCVDIATSWSEQRAIWNKEAQSVVEQIRAIENALPFPLLGFDSDNGSEFINEQLLKHFLSRQKPVMFTRSRAYHKNDNAHVEQKNWTHVRQWLGYERIDNPEAVKLLNNLYANEWRLYHNFFNASVKLMAKERHGGKIIKKYDKPKTPYQRVLESQYISDYVKSKLTDIFKNTNPFILRKLIDKKLREVFRLTFQRRLDMNRDPGTTDMPTLTLTN